MDPGAPLAFAAGVLAFTSPCCLPLLPGYLAFVSGLAGEDDGRDGLRRTLIGASLFVLGFAAVFTALGASASVLGGFLLENRDVILKVCGAFLAVMGLSMLIGANIPLLSRGLQMDVRGLRRGPAGAFPLGMAFAFSWTPCIGPVLAGLLTYAGASGSLAVGAGLLFVYSLGLGVAFMATAVLYRRASRSFSWLRRHGSAISRSAGVVLIAMGVLLVVGGWQELFAPVLRWYGRLGWPPI